MSGPEETDVVGTLISAGLGCLLGVLLAGITVALWIIFA